MGGGEGKRRGFLKSSTRMVALMITSLSGCMGSAYWALSCRDTLDHFNDSAIAWARRIGSVLKREREREKYIKKERSQANTDRAVRVQHLQPLLLLCVR